MAEHDHNEDFVSFEEALRELKIKRDDLRKLVSEGEIRAIKDGVSMKFRRDEIERLTRRDSTSGFEALEDDTGMVTEELTDEETLLAEDDLVEEAKPARGRKAAAAPARARPAKVEIAEEAKEPTWVTAAAILCAVVLVYGLMIVYGVAAEQSPAGFTGVFAKS